MAANVCRARAATSAFVAASSAVDFASKQARGGQDEPPAAATSRGNPGFGTYSASKAAIRQYARVWAAELAPRNIRVNVLVPGPTDTPGLRGLAGNEAYVPALLAQMAATTPLRRVADPGEIAQAALFLASTRSSFMTGSELFADGGEVQVFPAA